ncbi:MAG: anti-sigma factor family protein [Phycisphaerae bacterium]
MNCVEAEQLYDAYLDGELGGSLRLEFDAHRLRCPLCQQKLAMLEACEQIIAGDRRTPALSDDFTDRVMAQIAGTRVTPQPLSMRRLYVGIGGGLSVAAAVALVFMLRPALDAPIPGDDRSSTLVAGKTDDSGKPAISTELAKAMEDKTGIELQDYMRSKLDTVGTAGRNIVRDVRQLPSLAVHMALAGEMNDISPLNPLSWMFGISDQDNGEDQDASDENGRYSL